MTWCWGCNRPINIPYNEHRVHCVVSVPCETCGSEPGQMCTTPGGRIEYSRFHAARVACYKEKVPQ